MTLDGIYSPAAILKLKGYTLREKLLLGLAGNFNGKGLRASNAELGELLGIQPSWVSDLLCNLERKGCIEIANRQSRHRVIYFRRKPEVDAGLLPAKTESRNALLPVPTPSTSGGSRNIIHKAYKRTHSAQKDPCDNGAFDRFWSAYPKKREKGKAREVWKKLKPTSELTQRILAAVEQQRQSADWLKDGGKYIPYPAKWLKAEQWEDEIGGNGELTHDATEEEADALLKEVACGG